MKGGDEPPQDSRASRFKSMFSGRGKQKIREDRPKMNVKGQKAYNSGAAASGAFPEVNQAQIERQFYGIETGPRMPPRAQRFKVWGALGAIGLWFTGCFSLVAYRLRSDDLELMEREVYEELRVKKEVERFQER